MLRRLLMMIGVLLFTAKFVGAEPVETGFLDRSITLNGTKYNYVLYVPRSYTPTKSLPVILFLHGSGERGDDGLKQSQTGIGSAIRAHPDRFPALVVMPQCSAGKNWSGEQADFALKATDETVEKYHGDKDRLYLTGLSMGGFGSWTIASEHPDKFAAVVPICGRGDPAKMATLLKEKPIWVFHGDADQSVKVEYSREMVKALQDAGSKTIKYTEYPGVGHNSWDKAYDDKEMLDWLFMQKRKIRITD